MSHRLRGPSVTLALVACALVAAGCAGPADIAATGRVEEHTASVSAPLLLAATPDRNAGFEPAPSSPVVPTPVAAVRVADAAPLGTRVRAGEPVAHVEGAEPDAAWAAAQADAALALRRVELIDARAADLADKRSDLTGKRRDVTDALATLANARSQALATRTDLQSKQATLAAQRAQLKAKRAEVASTVGGLAAKRTQVVATLADLTDRHARLAATLAGLRHQRADLAATPDSPERTAGLAALDAAIADAATALDQLASGRDQAASGLAQLDAGLAAARAGLAQLDVGSAQADAGAAQLSAGLSRLAAGLRTLDDNQAKARDGLAKLDDGLAQLDDAAASLADARDLARIAVTSTDVAAQRARQQRDLVTLVAPADGVVVRTSLPGAVVAPGAPVVVVRTDAAASVTAWLAPDAAARLCPGATGTVRTDWGATHSVTVARVGVRADYPPTAQATDDVHLTRAVSVTVTLDSGETLPPGAPVDLTLIPCKEASHG